MWSDRRLLELFEIEHPIVLAPMAGFGTVELAAAVADWMLLLVLAAGDRNRRP